MLNIEYLTPAEVAEKLKIHPSTLTAWRKKDRGPNFFRIGKQVRYPRTEIEKWISDRERRQPA